MKAVIDREGPEIVMATARADLMVVVGFLQLAMRHPGVTPALMVVGRQWTEQVIRELAKGDDDLIAAFICGFDRQYDVPC